ncbi:hypothetical protein DAPPUDRAFT_248391 [Daphnia pulex]|uniref:Uncharacterized protein n=1 Tax=Daphnia pulex TaxID=6669 RepID=E9GUK0_DAPPU|nr:hypothetical protein DAPPUDRAFT_248391 [Daphnia pulex]|eukprot:EFX76736.1 hypothetical protein DAPPUDRAFT_248391 [Daphnia pulex]
MSLKTTVWSFALRVCAVWYPVNMAMRYLVPSLFVFPFTDMELSTVCTEMGKTLALTAQHGKRTIVLLDVQAKIRKIPATIISDDEEQVEIATDPRYLPGIEDSVGFVIETKEEPCESEEELEEEVNNDEPVLELEDIPDEEGDSEKENIATNQQTNQ